MHAAKLRRMLREAGIALVAFKGSVGPTLCNPAFWCLAAPRLHLLTV